MRSDYRRAVRTRNRKVVRICQSLPDLAAVRRYRERIVPQEIRDELDEQVGRLRPLIGSPVAA